MQEDTKIIKKDKIQDEARIGNKRTEEARKWQENENGRSINFFIYAHSKIQYWLI